jgi:hypothetical protein
MLALLKKGSLRLRFLSPLFVALGILGLAGIGSEIFMTIIPGEEDILLIPSAVLFLWSLVGLIALSTFPNVPEPDPEAAFLVRMKTALVRTWFYVLGLLFVTLAIVSIYLTSKLLGIWLA